MKDISLLYLGLASLEKRGGRKEEEREERRGRRREKLRLLFVT